MKYKAKSGASFGDDRAQIYGKELEKIEKKFGLVTPKIVVQEAKNRKSPLHDYFDWDTKNAAEKYWLVQARTLINHIEITVTMNGEEQEVRAYLNVTSTETNGNTEQVYVTVEKALTDEEYKKQVLETAIREIEYWKYKYSQYKELSEIFDAISNTKNKFKF